MHQELRPEILDVRRITRDFGGKRGLRGGQQGTVRAVDDVSFIVRRGEAVGLVGESGCGKSTLARMCVGLLEPTAGSLSLDGVDLTAVRRSSRKKRAWMRERVQIVFQDPFASLDPRKTVLQIVGEPLEVAGWSKDLRVDRVVDLLAAVGLDKSALSRLPRHFSGGQRQRISIARALALDPDLLVLDEPVSALDVSVQAQVLNLLQGLRKDRGLAYLLISHDLSVVGMVADRLIVMYLGAVVESGATEQVFSNPGHPYTKALISAVPNADRPTNEPRIVLTGDLPSPAAPPSGCPFRTRCWKAQAECAEQRPSLVEGSEGHWVACHFPEVSA